MSVILGLTGSIGMGKSTTAQFFHDAGVPVWDADATVHRLYGAGELAAKAIGAAFPSALAADGSVDRAALRGLIAADRSVLDRINAIVHPLVAADRATFLRDHAEARLVVLDIPLLFETGGDRFCDATLVVSVDPETQRARVLARGTTEADFQMILARQMPDADKRARATHVIETRTLDQTRAQVLALIDSLTQDKPDA